MNHLYRQLLYVESVKILHFTVSRDSSMQYSNRLMLLTTITYRKGWRATIVQITRDTTQTENSNKANFIDYGTHNVWCLATFNQTFTSFLVWTVIRLILSKIIWERISVFHNLKNKNKNVYIEKSLIYAVGNNWIGFA